MKHSGRYVIVIWALALSPLASCVTPQPQPTPSLQTSNEPVTVEDSNFEKSVTFKGPQVYIEHQLGPWKFSPIVRDLFFLRSYLLKETGEVRHQLYVRISYGEDWRFVYGANDSEAQSLEFIQIDRDPWGCSRSGCNHTEDFAAIIPDSALRDSRKGYSVKFYAKNGKDIILTVTEHQITAQLDAIKRYMQSKVKS